MRGTLSTLMYVVVAFNIVLTFKKVRESTYWAPEEGWSLHQGPWTYFLTDIWTAVGGSVVSFVCTFI